MKFIPFIISLIFSILLIFMITSRPFIPLGYQNIFGMAYDYLFSIQIILPWLFPLITFLPLVIMLIYKLLKKEIFLWLITIFLVVLSLILQIIFENRLNYW